MPDLRRWRTVLGLLVFVLVGVGAGWLVGRLGRTVSPPTAALLLTWWDLLWVVPVMWVVSLVHELGHVVGGLAVGSRFLLLIAGPLKVTATARGLAVGVNRNLALAGGLAACLPTAGHDLRRRLAVMAAGGPVASLLLAGAAALGAWALGPFSGRLGFVLLLLAAISAAIALVTLFPGTTSGFATDGAQLLGLWRGGPEVEARALVITLQAASFSGVRPRDLDAGLIARVGQLGGATLWGEMGRMFAYYHTLDQGQVVQAGEHLDALMERLSTWPEGAQQAVLAEAAYFTARHRQDPARARRWLARPDGLTEPAVYKRAEAAILLAEGRPAEARAAATAALAATRDSLDQGGAIAERDWLTTLLAASPPLPTEAGR